MKRTADRVLRVYICVRAYPCACVHCALAHSLSLSLSLSLSHFVPRATVSFQRAASRSAVDDVRLVSNEIRTYTPPRKVRTLRRARACALSLSFRLFLPLLLSPSARRFLSLSLCFCLSHSLTLSQSLALFRSNSVSLTACRKESREVSFVSFLFLSLSLSPHRSYPFTRTRRRSSPPRFRRVTTVAKWPLLLLHGTRTTPCDVL